MYSHLYQTCSPLGGNTNDTKFLNPNSHSYDQMRIYEINKKFELPTGYPEIKGIKEPEGIPVDIKEGFTPVSCTFNRDGNFQQKGLGKCPNCPQKAVTWYADKNLSHLEGVS